MAALKALSGEFNDHAFRILLVDDRDDVRLPMTDLLEAMGYEVLTASNGRQGLDVLAANHVDLVISDYDMPPGMNGIEMLDEIRADEEKKDLPVIITSGSDIGPEAIEHGATLYVQKGNDLLGPVIEIEQKFHAGTGMPGPAI